MEKKVNGVLLFIIVVLLVALGVAGGYFIGMKTQNTNTITESKLDNETKLEEKNIQKPENTQVTETEEIAETIKYDGQKDITIKGKKYTISYVSEKEDTKKLLYSEGVYTYVDLYLNNRKVKTFDMQYLIDVNHEYGEKDYDVEVYQFCEDYILIAVKSKYNDGMAAQVDYAKFCIVNTDGQHIDSFEWDNASRTIVVATNEELTYKVSNDALIIQEGYVEMKYTVKRDIIIKEGLKVYKEGELIFPGK